MNVAIFMVSIAFLFWLWTWLVKHGRIQKKEPPGPVGLPVIGCVHMLTSATAYLKFHDWSKRYGPIFQFMHGNRRVIVLADHGLIKDALRQEAFNGKMATISGQKGDHQSGIGIFAAEGSRWKQQRKFAITSLGMLEPMGPKILDEVHELITSIEDTRGQPFDPEPMLYRATANFVCRLLFGHRFDEDSQLANLLDEINYRTSKSGFNKFSLITVYPWLAKLYPGDLRRRMEGEKELNDFLQQEIDSARSRYSDDEADQDGGDSFVDAFDKAKISDHGNFFGEDAQLRAAFVDLIIGGSDTAATVLRWALFYVTGAPEIQDSIYRQISNEIDQEKLPDYADRKKFPLLQAALMEAQRCASPLPWLSTRWVSEDTKLGHYSIPKNSLIVPLIWVTHHNTEYFPDPEKFDPYRFLDEDQKILKTDVPFFPFSAGKRVCLGRYVARMELFLFFASMLHQFKFSFASENDRGVLPVVGAMISPGKFLVRAEKR